MPRGRAGGCNQDAGRAQDKERGFELWAEARRLENVPRQRITQIAVAMLGAETGAADRGVVTERVHHGVALWALEGTGVIKDREVKVTAEHDGPEGRGEAKGGSGMRGEEGRGAFGDEGVVAGANTYGGRVVIRGGGKCGAEVIPPETIQLVGYCAREGRG